jgi:hypothetical protein
MNFQQQECEHLKNCPIFEKCKTGLIENIFGELYCKGPKMDQCARKKLKKEGKNVPINLLPNGEYIDSLKDC